MRMPSPSSMKRLTRAPVLRACAVHGAFYRTMAVDGGNPTRMADIVKALRGVPRAGRVNISAEVREARYRTAGYGPRPIYHRAHMLGAYVLDIAFYGTSRGDKG